MLKVLVNFCILPVCFTPGKYSSKLYPSSIVSFTIVLLPQIFYNVFAHCDLIIQHMLLYWKTKTLFSIIFSPGDIFYGRVWYCFMSRKGDGIGRSRYSITDYNCNIHDRWKYHRKNLKAKTIEKVKQSFCIKIQCQYIASVQQLMLYVDIYILILLYAVL